MFRLCLLSPETFLLCLGSVSVLLDDKVGLEGNPSLSYVALGSVFFVVVVVVVFNITEPQVFYL